MWKLCINNNKTLDLVHASAKIGNFEVILSWPKFKWGNYLFNVNMLLWSIMVLIEFLSLQGKYWRVVSLIILPCGPRSFIITSIGNILHSSRSCIITMMIRFVNWYKKASCLTIISSNVHYNQITPHFCTILNTKI